MGRSLKPLALLCAAALLAAVVSACQVTKASKEGKSPLKLLHANGQSFVPARADRVVTLESESLDDVLAFGVKPIGTATTTADGHLPRYLGRRTAGVEIVGPAWRLDLRKIERLDPDLILGSKRRQGSIYGRLKDISSTITVEQAGKDWKLNLRLYGEALGRPDQGERLLDDYDRRAASVRRALGRRRGTTASVVETAKDGVRVYSLGAFSGSILADVGLKRPPAQDVDIVSASVSPDQIPSLDAGAVFLARAPGDGATYRRLTSDPRWRALRAVRSGHVYRVSDDAWIVGQGLLASRAVMADLRRTLGR
jgi:iron-siderophore transport system substrate-binding protein